MFSNKSNDGNLEPTGAEKTEGNGFEPELEVFEFEDAGLDKVSGGLINTPLYFRGCE